MADKVKAFDPTKLSPGDRKLWDSMSGNAQKSIMGAISKGTGKVAETAKKGIKSLADMMNELIKPTEEVLQAFDALVASTRQFQSENQKFFQAGYTQSLFSFADAISAANQASLKLNGNLKAAQNVTTAFRDKTLALAVASRSFTKTLVESGVVLQGAGFEMRDFAAIVDSAAFAFNKNESEIKGLTSTLINVQREIPVSGRTLAENFRFAQKNFAYSADKMMDNFIGLQKMSVTTGVSFGELTNAFGSSMDTFEGSAQKAGKLNQILGRSAFNSMELLAMTETERATRIRSAIMESGRSIEDMGKFELISLQKTIGLGSVEETRKFLRGDLKIDEAKALRAIEAKDPTALRGKQLNESLDFLRKGIDRTRPVADRLQIALSNVSVEASKNVISTGKASRKLLDLGLTIDQILPSLVTQIYGGRPRRRDATTPTGLETVKFGAIERIAKINNNTVKLLAATGASTKFGMPFLAAAETMTGIFDPTGATMKNLDRIADKFAAGISGITNAANKAAVKPK